MGVPDLCLGVTASLPGIKAETEQTLLTKITLFDCSHITKIRDQISYVSHAIFLANFRLSVSRPVFYCLQSGFR